MGKLDEDCPARRHDQHRGDALPRPRLHTASLRGRTFLSVHFAYVGDLAEGERIAAELRAAAPVYLDNLGILAARDIGLIHSDPTEPGPGWASGGLLDAIDDDFITARLGLFGTGKRAPAVACELRHLGNATKTDVPGGSASGGRAFDYSLALISVPNPALFGTVMPEVADAMFAVLAPWFSAETKVNFGGARRPGQVGVRWSADKLTRLLGIRAAHDPAGVFG